jgi:hypothetical protein
MTSGAKIGIGLSSAAAVIIIGLLVWLIIHFGRMKRQRLERDRKQLAAILHGTGPHANYSQSTTFTGDQEDGNIGKAVDYTDSTRNLLHAGR